MFENRRQLSKTEVNVPRKKKSKLKSLTNNFKDIRKQLEVDKNTKLIDIIHIVNNDTNYFETTKRSNISN